MKNLICLALTFFSFSGYAQEALLTEEELKSAYTYESLEEALNDPKNVIKLDLGKKELLNLDYDFRKLVNLQWLNLSKNGFKTFPMTLTEFTKLQYLDLSGNEIDKIPDEFGKLINLKHLNLSKNKIYVLSTKMGELKKLESLELWENPIKNFPPELHGMIALKLLDLRVTRINEEEKKKLMKMFPYAKIKFSKTCDCN